ncbi:MAG: hypothetical protein RLZZ262_61, partial [Bacteroidota bacterium]
MITALIISIQTTAQYQFRVTHDWNSRAKNLFHHPCDIDGDGDIDVFSVYSSDYMYNERYELAINDGLGQFELVDIGYGFMDPMFISGIHDIREIRAVEIGDGGFKEIFVWLQNFSYPMMLFQAEPMRYASFPLHPNTEEEVGFRQLYDIDQDGDLDVAIRDDQNQPLWSINGSMPYWNDPTIPRTESLYYETLDVDSDGIIDMFEFDHQSNQLIWRKKFGEGSYGPVEVLIDDVDLTGSVRWMLKDMNGDGLDDFIASSNDGKVYYAPRLSQTSFGVVSHWSNNLPLHFFYMANVLPTDFNGDGHLDIVLATAMDNDGKQAVLYNNGLGGFENPVIVEGGFLRDFIVADFNGNGILDIMNIADPRAIGRAFTVQLDVESSLDGAFEEYGLFLPSPILMDEDLDGKIDLVCEDITLETERRVVVSDVFNQPILPQASSNRLYHSTVDFDAELQNEVLKYDAEWANTYGYVDANGAFQLLASNLAEHVLNTTRLDLDGDGLKDDYYIFQWVGSNMELQSWVHNGATDFIEDVVVLPNFEDIGIPSAMIVSHSYKILDGDNDGWMEYYYLDANYVTKRIEMTVTGAWSDPTVFFDHHVDIVHAGRDEISNEPFVVGYIVEESDCGDYKYTGEVEFFKLSNSGEISDSFEWVASTENPCLIRFGNSTLDFDHDGNAELTFLWSRVDNHYEAIGVALANGILLLKELSIDIPDEIEWYSSVDWNGIYDMAGNVIQSSSFIPIEIEGFSWLRPLQYIVLQSTAGYGCGYTEACNYNSSSIHLESLCCYGTCGCTDNTALNYDPEADCDNGSCQIGVTGRVFHDVIGNGVFDEGDYGLAYQTVTTTDGSSSFITNENGVFSAVTGSSNVLLRHVEDPNFPYYTTPYMYQTNIASGLAVDFGLSMNEPLAEVDVDIYHHWYLCDDDVTFYISYRNRGNTILNGQLEFTYDPLITGHQAISPITSESGTTLIFDFENLMPGQMQMKMVSLHTPDFTFMGELMDFSVLVNGYV